MDSSKFPFEIFPREFQALITHLKIVSGFDTNLSSLAFLSASATSIGNAVKINNGKYFAKPILWCVLVGDSGTRKSTYNSESINQAIQDSSNLIFESLYNYGETELKVSKEVDLIYKDWFDSSQVNCFNDPFSKALQSKLETYVWRFCIILDVLDQVSNDSRRTEIKAETMDKAIRLAEYFRKESTEIYQESFSEGILESQPQEFQKIYKRLEDREYKTSEIYSLLSDLWTPDNVNKKLAVPELFTKVRHGHYIKNNQRC
jgi:hypothetical protein